MHAVYVIQHDVSKDIYIGVTSNLKARLAQHNARENTSTVRKVGTWEFAYVELYRNEQDARVRERKLKSHGSGKHELLKRIKRCLL